MRAWRVLRQGEPRDVLELVDLAPPEPGPGMLRVRVSTAAVGLPDLYMCHGSYPLTPEIPFTPGQEIAGVVTAVGAGARARVGDRVMAVSAFFLQHGGFAEEALALDEFAFAVPDAMGDAEAAGFLIAYHTAYVGLVRRADLREGETLLVLGGAGGTGSAAIQLGRALGARVLATAGSPEKVAFCKELGADAVVDYRSDDIAESVRALVGEGGVEVVYDPVGGEAFAAATRCIAHEGRMLLVGFASGRWGQPSPAHMATLNYSVLGVMPSRYDRDFKQTAQDFLVAKHAAGELAVSVAGLTPFDALPDALEDLARGRVMGKRILEGFSG